MSRRDIINKILRSYHQLSQKERDNADKIILDATNPSKRRERLLALSNIFGEMAVKLPNDVIIRILMFLPVKTLALARLISKPMKEVIDVLDVINLKFNQNKLMVAMPHGIRFEQHFHNELDIMPIPGDMYGFKWYNTRQFGVITQVSIAEEYVMLLSDDDIVYILMHKVEINDWTIPHHRVDKWNIHRVDKFVHQKVRQLIAIGEEGVGLVVTQDNNVYLLDDAMISFHIAKNVDTVVNTHNGYVYLSPKGSVHFEGDIRVPLTKNLNIVATQIASCYFELTTMILTDNGRLYIKLDGLDTQPFNLFTAEPVVSLAGGNNWFIFLTVSGHVYTWSHSDQKWNGPNPPTPKQIDPYIFDNVPIKRIYVTGHNSWMCMDINGTYHGFGGFDANGNILVPLVMPYKNIVNVFTSMNGVAFVVDTTIRNDIACHVCGDIQSTMYTCQSCRKSIYCSVECQTKDWPTHVCNIDVATQATLNTSPFEQLYVDSNVELAIEALEANVTLGPEIHAKSTQIIRIESGSGRMIVGNTTTDVLSAGSTVIVPAGASHTVIAGDSGIKFSTTYSPPK